MTDDSQDTELPEDEGGASAWAGPAEEGEEDLVRLEFVVPRPYDGWRIDHFIHARIPRLSRTRIQQMLRAQHRLSGQLLRPAQRVRAGEQIVLLRPAPEEPDVPRRFDVLFEDEHVLVIDKPSGLPVHSTARFHRNTLTAVLRERFPEGAVPRPCHRLDRETSGLMLLAHSRTAEVALKKDFLHRRVHKRYLAIVAGDPGEEGMIDEPIRPHPESGIRIKMTVGPGGQPARTRFRRLARRGEFSLVEACPETGRQHQIRVHLGARGCPVVGDKLYGPDPQCMLEYLETGWTPALAQRLLLPRQALHAAAAAFVHPASGRPMTVECPLAADLQAFWDAR